MSSSAPLVPNQKALTRTAARGPPVICSKSISCWRWIQITTVTQIKLQCIFRLRQLKCQSSEAQYLNCGNKKATFNPLRLYYELGLKKFSVTCENKQTLKNNAKIMKPPAACVRCLFICVTSFDIYMCLAKEIQLLRRQSINNGEIPWRKNPRKWAAMCPDKVSLQLNSDQLKKGTHLKTS